MLAFRVIAVILAALSALEASPLASSRAIAVPAPARAFIPSVNLFEMLNILAAPDKRLGADPVAARDALIDRALAAGWKKALDQGGADPAQWRWGDLHRVSISHPLSSLPGIAAATASATAMRVLG